MRTTSAVALGLSKLTFLALLSSTVVADENHSAEAVFGRGLNTAQPGNVVNHVVIPTDIRVKVGGVVDFAVAGFHDIIIFKPGFTLQDLLNAGGGAYPGFGPPVPPTNQPLYVLRPLPPPPPLPAPQTCLTSMPPTCIEWVATPTVPASPVPFDRVYYLGIRPAGGPEGTAGTANPSNAVNRSEIVAFLEKGTYLVICNVRPHLLDGMLAYVRVN